jgi:hypothetical protein
MRIAVYVKIGNIQQTDPVTKPGEAQYPVSAYNFLIN